jgi:hypothetical protein
VKKEREMRELYDAMLEATDRLARAVITVQDGTDEAAVIKATTIEIPDRVFGYLQRQMAMVIPEWGKTTKFDPLTEEMVINGISITRGKRVGDLFVDRPQ